MSWFPPRNLSTQHVAVVGAGILGRRVGLVWAAKGGHVQMVDTNKDTTKQALDWIHSELPGYSRKLKGVPGHCSSETSLAKAVENAWMVVECIPEIADVKIDFFGQLDALCAPTTILATISSSFKSGDLIGKVSDTGRRRVLNTHYFQPPELPPVEIMSSGYTDPAIIEFLVLQLREIGLDPVVAEKESTGFIFNRVWAAIKREVMMVLADNVGTPGDIDKLFRYGFQSQGAPCDLMDKVGLETVCNIEDHYIAERKNIPKYPVDYVRENYVDQGNLGVVSGKGLFDYRENTSRKKSLRDRLIGAWELVDYSAFSPDDPASKLYPMGKDAKGVIMYTSSGYMSAQLQIPGQPPFQSGDISGGSKDELAEAGKNYLAYTGPFYLDETGDEPLLQHHMSNSSFPNWFGNTQRRVVSISDDGDGEYLTLGPEAPAMVLGEMRMAQLAWRRLPDNCAAQAP